MYHTTLKLLDLAKGVSKHCIGMEGNISGKVDDEILLIKASGTRLSTLDDEDLIPFDFDGKQLDDLHKKGSMELSFHTFLLGFDDINFVAHTHPVNSLKLLCSLSTLRFAEVRLFPDQVVFNGAKSCFVPYGKPGIELTELIKTSVTKFISGEGYFPKLILLKNHGIITCGKTISECIIATDICEKAAEIFAGIPHQNMMSLSPLEIKELMNDEQEKYRQQQLK